MTGIAGYTLTGGMGLLQRKWGLACDNLLSVEVVTADGEVLQASVVEQSGPVLGAARRRRNFGIVTWFEFGLYPLGPEVYSAAVVYPVADAPALLRAWRDYAEQAPDEVTSEVLFWSMPPLPGPARGAARRADHRSSPGMYAGPADEGERALEPVTDVRRADRRSQRRVELRRVADRLRRVLPRHAALLLEIALPGRARRRR